MDHGMMLAKSGEMDRKCRSLTTPLLHRPTTRTHFANSMYQRSAPAIWNHLNTDTLCSSSLVLFKRSLKTFLFCKTFSQALAVWQHCNCPSSASEVNRHTGAIQISLLLLLLLIVDQLTMVSWPVQSWRSSPRRQPTRTDVPRVTGTM